MSSTYINEYGEGGLQGREFPGMSSGEHNHAQPDPAIVGNTCLLLDHFADSALISSRLCLLPQAVHLNPIAIATASKARLQGNRVPPLLRPLSGILVPLLLLETKHGPTQATSLEPRPHSKHVPSVVNVSVSGMSRSMYLSLTAIKLNGDWHNLRRHIQTLHWNTICALPFRWWKRTQADEFEF